MNNTLETTLTPAECGLVQEKLLRLLAQQAELYTRGGSSSIPVELAQELLSSICFCLDIPAEHPDERWRRLLRGDIAAVYQEGLGRVEKKLQFGKRLWQAVCSGLPPVESTSMLDTLQNMEAFWKKYDVAFFAHEVPCEMDYQLAIPVPDGVLGVDYVNQYLANLFCENRFLSQYSASAMVPLLERYCPDYRGLLVNLFEPVAANALGLAVLGEDDRALHIREEERSGLEEFFAGQTREEIQASLLQAIERLKANHPALGPETFAYLSGYCAQLAARIDLLRDGGGLCGVFLTA